MLLFVLLLVQNIVLLLVLYTIENNSLGMSVLCASVGFVLKLN